MADILIWGMETARRDAGGRFEKGDIVLIAYDFPALALMEIVFGKLIEMELNPLIRMYHTSAMERTIYGLGAREQILFRAPGEEELSKHLNGRIKLIAPSSLGHLSDIDPAKISLDRTKPRIERDLLQEREEKGLFSWTLCCLPTQAQAKQAGLSLEEYTEEIVSACHLDHLHPVQKWQEIYDRAREIKQWLDGLRIERLHVESKDIDLWIEVGLQRKWLGITGRNIPSREFFLSQDWRGTRDIFFADIPSFRNGNIIRNVRLEFRDGEAISIKAEEGESFAKTQLSIDEGARRTGEFSLTEKTSSIKRFMANTLFDENYGGEHGNSHIALGSSYTRSYSGDPKELDESKRTELGFNNSALHWDLINTGPKRVTAHLKGGGTKVIYENGMFII